MIYGVTALLDEGGEQRYRKHRLLYNGRCLQLTHAFVEKVLGISGGGNVNKLVEGSSLLLAIPYGSRYVYFEKAAQNASKMEGMLGINTSWIPKRSPYVVRCRSRLPFVLNKARRWRRCGRGLFWRRLGPCDANVYIIGQGCNACASIPVPEWKYRSFTAWYR